MRRYWHSRRAYSPRIWPMLPIAVATTPLGLVFDWKPIVAWPLAFVWASGVVRVRWWIWRRRHPVISPEEWIEDRVKAAPWN